MARATRRPRLPAPKITIGAERGIRVRSSQRTRRHSTRCAFTTSMPQATLSTLKAVIRDRIANTFPALLGIAAQKQIIFRNYRVNELRDLPQVIASMVSADRKHWLMLPKQVGGPPKCSRFRAFDIHLHVC